MILIYIQIIITWIHLSSIPLQPNSGTICPFTSKITRWAADRSKQLLLTKRCWMTAQGYDRTFHTFTDCRRCAGNFWTPIRVGWMMAAPLALPRLLRWAQFYLQSFLQQRTRRHKTPKKQPQQGAISCLFIGYHLSHWPVRACFFYLKHLAK